MPFFSQDFSKSIEQASNSIPDRDRYVNPSMIGKEGGVASPYRFSILSAFPLEGYELWIDIPGGRPTKRVIEGNSKPTEEEIKATAEAAGGTPAEAKEFGTGKLLGRPDIRRIVSFFVYEYDRSQVVLLTISQIGLMTSLYGKLGDPDFEDLTKWDCEITKEVKNDKTKYEVNMKPARRANADVEKEVKAAWSDAVAKGFNLDALMIGANPFKAVE